MLTPVNTEYQTSIFVILFVVATGSNDLGLQVTSSPNKFIGNVEIPGALVYIWIDLSELPVFKSAQIFTPLIRWNFVNYVA